MKLQQTLTQPETKLTLLTSLDALEQEIAREEARIYNVAPYYRPTKSQYERLLNLLKGSLSLHKLNEQSQDTIADLLTEANSEVVSLQRQYGELEADTTERINGLRHQINRLRDNIDQAITGSKVLFRFGKVVILK